VNKSEHLAYNRLFNSVFRRKKETKRGIDTTFYPDEVSRTFADYFNIRSEQYEVHSKVTEALTKKMRKWKKKDKVKTFGSIEGFRTFTMLGEVYAEILEKMSKDFDVMLLFSKILFATSMGAYETHEKQPIVREQGAILSKKEMVSATALRIFLQKQQKESGKILPYVG
jgi:hypothetical protein